MNRRDAFRSIAGVTALTLVAENAIAEPSQADIDRVNKTVAESPWAGKLSPNYLNVISHADYDLLHVPAGHTVPERAYMFSQPIGSLLPGSCPNCGSDRMVTRAYKTLLDTNMYRGNQFPAPEARAIQRIVFLFSPTMDEVDRNRMISKSVWEFRLSDKVVGRAPLAWSPIEGQLVDLIEFDGDMPKRIGRNDRKLSPGQYVHLQRPVEIMSQQHFSVEITTEPFTARGDIDMYVLLDGLGAFGVQ